MAEPVQRRNSSVVGTALVASLITLSLTVLAGVSAIGGTVQNCSLVSVLCCLGLAILGGLVCSLILLGAVLALVRTVMPE